MMGVLKKIIVFLPEEIFYISILCGLLGVIIGEAILLILSALALIGLIIFELIQYFLKGRTGPLQINTPDGSNQPYHPATIFFDKEWNGYRYWMAYTPFPIGALPYQDRWEYPCIAVSQDGISWQAVGSNLPLDDLTKEQIENKDYFSDPHLVYNQKVNRLECFYRLSTGKAADEEKNIYIFRRFTTDGTHWSEREPVSHIAYKSDVFPAISPAIEIIDNVYHMWYVLLTDNKKKHMKIYHSVSADGLNWDCERLCNLSDDNIDPWHLDCRFYNGRYYMLTYDFSHRIVLWESEDGYTFTYMRTVLTPSHICGSFYEWTLYRSCLLRDNAGYKIYFSAGNERKLGIGLMTGETLASLEVVSASNCSRIREFVLDLLEKYTCHVRTIIKKLSSIKLKRGK